MVKQWIVMRKDLSMSKGKMVAQGSHASLAIFLNRLEEKKDLKMIIPYTESESEWLFGSFTKICLGIKSEDELLAIYEKAKELELPTVLITDQKLSARDDKPVHTCIAVGPCEEEKVRDLLGHLKPM